MSPLHRQARSLGLALLLGGCSLIDTSGLRPDCEGPLCGGEDAGSDATAPAIALALPELVQLRRGGFVDISVSVARTGTVTDPVLVALDLGTRVGLTADEILIPEGETRGTLRITAAAVGELSVGVTRLDVTAVAGELNDARATTLVVADHAGVLDVSFAGGGVQTSSALRAVRRLAVGDDGTVYVAGTYLGGETDPSAIVAFNEDGTVQTSFGTDGILDLDIDVFDLALRSSGLIAAGDQSTQLGLRAYTPQGTLDPSFGTLGKVTLGPATFPSSTARAIAIDPNDNIYAGGRHSGANQGTLWRIYSTGDVGGSLDISALGQLAGVALQSTGQIVVMAQAADLGSPQPLLSRVSWNDNELVLDASFGVEGTASFDAIPCTPYRLAVGPNDHIAVTAQGLDGATEMQVGLMKETGEPIFWNSPSIPLGSSSWGQGVAIDSDGRVLSSGYGTSNGGQYRSAAVARQTNEGSFDESFDSDGYVFFDGNGDGYPRFELRDLTLDKYGRILAAGIVDNELLIVRIWN